MQPAANLTNLLAAVLCLAVLAGAGLAGAQPPNPNDPFARDMPIGAPLGDRHTQTTTRSKPEKDPFSDLPQLGNTETLETSLAEEYLLGRQILREFRGQAPLVKDMLAYEYLELLSFRILQHSEVSDRRISLLLFDTPMINAFAAPGGIIGMFSGMMTFMDNEGELASIIAHEFAHLSQRHYARGQEYSARTTWRNILLGLASVLVAASSSADSGAAAIAATQAGIYAEQLAFSRENEREADQIASDTLLRSGYDPIHVAHAFRRLNSAYGSGTPPEYLLTHPLPSNRRSEALLRASQSPVDRPPLQDLDFQIVRARLLFAQSSLREKYDGLFADWEKTAATHRRYAQAYGHALVLAQLDKVDEARKIMDWLLAQLPQHIMVQYGRAEIELLAGQPEETLEHLAKPLNTNPHNIPLLWLRAQALHQAKDIVAAIRTLELIVHLQQDNLAAWYQLAELHGLNSDVLSVHKSRAEYFFLVGQDKQAVEHLRYALKMARHNFAESERLRARIRSIQGDPENRGRGERGGGERGGERGGN